jgi:CRP-like cAMP-binding protein
MTRQTKSAAEHEALRTVAIKGPLFHGLPDEPTLLLLAAATVRQSQEGTALFHQGDPPEQVLQVVHGLVRMSQLSPDGVQTTFRIMRPGELLGCVAALQQFPYPATATAIEGTTVLAWHAGQFADLMRQYPAIMDNTLRIVGTRMKDMIQRMGDLTDRNVERRIAAALLRLADQAGTRTADVIEIQFPVTRDDLAEMAGLTYFTISRTLSLWQKQGLVRSGRQRMTILDLQRLGRIAEGTPGAAPSR